MTSIRGVKIDEKVVAKLKEGDAKAQSHVYEVLGPRVYSMVLRIMADPQAAEDITQDTFVDVITKAKTIKEPKSFVGWVRTIAVNHCYMRIRSPWYRRRIEVVLPEEGYEHDTTNQIDIEHALAKMDTKTRLVVWLYCVEGYTHQEIGTLLKRSTSYSKVIISRLSTQFNKNQYSKSESPNPDFIASWSTLSCP